MISENSHYITYTGQTKPLLSHMNGFRPAHGGVPGMQVRIENFCLQWERGNTAMVTYEQHLYWPDGTSRIQTGTALFGTKSQTPNGIEWLHIQHTEQAKSEV